MPASATVLDVVASCADVRCGPQPHAPLDTQLLRGESLYVEEIRDGWARGRLALDDHEGWVPLDRLGEAAHPPTHRVGVRASFIYPLPDIKVPPLERLSLGARVSVAETAIPGTATRRHFARLEGEGFMIEHHLQPLDTPVLDWVAVAEAMLGAPYLWGGRTEAGLDCSALMQLALQAAGHACPRDSAPQAEWVTAIDPAAPRRRGDLIFWKGHVGVMLDGTHFLHANAHHMATVVEPLEDVVQRIDAIGVGAPTLFGRPPG